MNTRKNTSHNVALAAMLAALALIFSYIEAILPLSAGIPGVKLGIANLVVIVALYVLGFKYAMIVNVLRILVAGLLFNGAFGAMYSMAGGVLSLTVMYLLKKTNLFSTVGISMAGGVAHNLGQLLVAALIVSTMKLFYYFPVLLFSGMISGILIGIVAALTLKRLPANRKHQAIAVSAITFGLLFLKSMIAPVGHSFIHAPQLTHLCPSILARFSSIRIASNLHAFLHLPQPMQPTLHFFIVTGPLSLFLHMMKTSSFFLAMRIT